MKSFRYKQKMKDIIKTQDLEKQENMQQQSLAKELAENHLLISESTTDENKKVEEITCADNNDENKACFQQEEKNEREFLKCTLENIYELAQEFPNENVAKDLMSEPFRIYATGKTGDYAKLYKDYLDIKKAFNDSKNDDSAREISGQNDRRNYSSFDVSASCVSPSLGLTKRQMQIARESGMSYREYSELLGALPHKKI